MIEYIKGEIAELTPTQIVMETGGVGFELNISLTTYSAFNGCSEGKIYVYEVIREDAHLLFGFATKDERELFLLLTSVSGVGPNTARMILSSITPSDLIQVIASGDEKSLTLIKGIGSRTAQRIIVDLKNKVKTTEGKINTAQISGHNEITDEAVAALTMLGFQRAASQKVVVSIMKKNPSNSVEQLIKEALKIL